MNIKERLELKGNSCINNTPIIIWLMGNESPIESIIGAKKIAGLPGDYAPIGNEQGLTNVVMALFKESTKEWSYELSIKAKPTGVNGLFPEKYLIDFNMSIKFINESIAPVSSFISTVLLVSDYITSDYEELIDELSIIKLNEELIRKKYFTH